MSISPVTMTNNIQNRNNTSSFNGIANAAKLNEFKDVYDGLIEKAAKKIVAPILNSNEKFIRFIDKTAQVGDMPNHLSTLGAAATSGFYVRSTLKNENLKKHERQTLAINQALVFGVSTLGAYFMNDKISKFVDKVKYKYIDYNQNNPKLGSRIKGFKTASGLMVFALMYRYISPVVVTPVASWIHKKADEHRAAKQGNQANNVA